ncbi:MAG: response regulator [Alphaproteobacteria bacterium]|nr:response regulator [Rhodospirillales bacterium]MCW9044920.1 response regulator [Alphaproteobacteria bacterium]
MADELSKILHVDDEADIREVAKLALEAVGGFNVETCSSGSEAVEKAPGFQPQLILLDVMMPEMDGPTTMAKLRELPGMESTPVIFMTAKAMPAEIEHFKQLGAIDVLAKPFDPMALAEQVRACWSTNAS